LGAKPPILFVSSVGCRGRFTTKYHPRGSGAGWYNVVVRREGPDNRESNPACHLSHASPRRRRGARPQGARERVAQGRMAGAGAGRVYAHWRGLSPRGLAGGSRQPFPRPHAPNGREFGAHRVIKRAAARKGTTELRWSSAGTRNTDRTTLVVTQSGSPTAERRQRRGGADRRAGVRGQGSPRFALDVRWRWVTEPRAGRPRVSAGGGAGLGR